MTTAILGIRAVAIDLDGTLLDTIPDLCGAVNLVLADLNFAPLPIDLVKTFVGKGLGEHMRKSLRAAMGREADDGEKARAMSLYKKHYAAHVADQTTIYPGVVEGLDTFKSRGLPMSVVTNKWATNTETLLAHFGLSGYFDHIACGDPFTTNISRGCTAKRPAE